MKKIASVNLDSTSMQVDKLVLNDSDIQIMKSNATADSIADTPTELFKGLTFKYSTQRDARLRRAMQTDKNDFHSYFIKEKNEMNEKKIFEDFGKLDKVAIIDSKGKETGLFIISFKKAQRQYLKIVFDFNAIKLELNQTKGTSIKS